VRLAQNSQLTFEITTTQKGTQTFMGQENKTQGLTKYVLAIRVAEANPQGYTLEVQIKEVFSQSTANGETSTYSSAAPSQDIGALAPTQQVFTFLAGQKFGAQINPRGQVQNLSGAEAITQHLLTKLQLGQDLMGNAVREAVQLQFGPAAFKKMIEQCFFQFPETPLAAGIQWNKTLADEAVKIPTTAQSQFRVVSITGQVVTVKANGTLRSDGSRKVTMAGFQFSADVAGNTQSEYELILSSGLLRKATHTQTLAGKLLAGEGGALQVPLTSQNQTSVRLLN
jgi:hypothetical protein